MAVYKQTYRGYDGPLTPAWSRFLILYRSARRGIFHSKLLLAFFTVCFLPPLFDLVVIYTMHNAVFLDRLGIHLTIGINRSFFFSLLHYQCVLAFLFTAFAAPGLVAPDLANGALALYLARPLHRFEYVAGKFALLFVLLSELTWIPGLLLFGIQCSLGGAAWRAQNLWLAGSLILASWIWIVVLSLLALALSAWVKWRIAAGAALLGVYFFGAGFAEAINLVLRTDRGWLLDLMQMQQTVAGALFRLEPSPLETAAWLVLAAVCAASLLLILRKVRPLEIVK